MYLFSHQLNCLMVTDPKKNRYHLFLELYYSTYSPSIHDLRCYTKTCIFIAEVRSKHRHRLIN